MMKPVYGLLLCVSLAITACSTSQTRLTEDFDRSVKAFNRMLRWQEVENAGMIFIDDSVREAYLQQAATLKKRGFSVTDYRILTTRYIPEKRAGDVIAEFDYYLLPSNRINTISYRQDWVYQEENKAWKLRSSLPAFE